MIHNKIYLFIPWFLMLSTVSYADTIYVESTIESASVYYQGAEVSRTASLTIPSGNHTLIFDELPYEISDKEYQLRSSLSEAIVGLKLKKQQGKLKGKSKLTKSLEDQIDKLIEESKAIKQKATILDKKKAILLSNSQVHAQDEGVDINKLEQALMYFEQKLESIRQERLELQNRLKAIDKEYEALNKRIQNSVRVSNKNYAQVIVQVDVPTKIEVDFTLSYYVKTAGWRPTYNLKVDGIDVPLSLEVQAEVFQTSGEDWNNVSLKLNDAKPTKASDFPEFDPWYLEQPRPIKQKQTIYTVLEGVVGDATSGDILAYSEIEVKHNDKVFKRLVTDEYGVFKINPIPIGRYTIVVKNKGFHDVTKHVDLSIYETKFLEIGLTDDKKQLITLEDVEAKPIRGVSGLVAQTAGIAQADQSASLTVRGGRSAGTVYFVDGVKVLGTPNISNMNTVEYDFKEKRHINSQINQEQLNTQYELESFHQILSNGEENTIRIKTLELPTTYEYMVFAKEDPAAYLKGKILNMNTYSLLSGRANIYFKGEYVGQTHLNTQNLSDTTSLFLGKDNDIQVERIQRVKINNKFKTIGKTRSDLDVVVSVKNNKTNEIDLVVVEQYPITKYKEILINVTEAEGAKNDEKMGRLEWKLKLQPNDKQDVNYKYTIKHPDAITID